MMWTTTRNGAENTRLKKRRKMMIRRAKDKSEQTIAVLSAVHIEQIGRLDDDGADGSI